MFIPANFAIGALVGAAASYVYKDEAARATLSGLGGKIKGGVSSTLGMLKKKPEMEESIAEQEEVDVVEEVKSDKV